MVFPVVTMTLLYLDIHNILNSYIDIIDIQLVRVSLFYCLPKFISDILNVVYVCSNLFDAMITRVFLCEQPCTKRPSVRRERNIWQQRRNWDDSLRSCCRSAIVAAAPCQAAVLAASNGLATQPRNIRVNNITEARDNVQQDDQLQKKYPEPRTVNFPHREEQIGSPTPSPPALAISMIQFFSPAIVRIDGTFLNNNQIMNCLKDITD